MPNYKITFYNDMGHLLIENYNNIPENIRNFAYKVIENKINYATDNNKHGCRFYILKVGLEPTWTYSFNNCEITIDYSQLSKFNPSTMIYI